MTTTWKGRADPLASYADNVPITYHDATWPHSYAASLSLAAEVKKRISEFDVLHVHQVYFFHGLIASSRPVRRQVPTVISPHGVFHPFHQKVHRLKKTTYTVLLERRNLERANAFHYASIAEQSHAADAGLPDKAFVIPLAVEWHTDHGVAPLFQLYPELNDRILVTFLGRLTAIKRLDLLVEAFAKVAAENSALHLVIAGPDSQGVGFVLRSQIDRLGIGGRVSFVGFVTGQLKGALLAASRMMVLPSENESFGLAVVEAMAAGVPVVISEGVAIHKEVAAAEAGFVVDRDSRQIAAAIRLLLSPDVHTSLSSNARSLVESTFGVDKMADGLENMYNTLVEQGPMRDARN